MRPSGPVNSPEPFDIGWENIGESVWVTREGEEIPYEELEDDHLDNIIAMMRSRIEEAYSYSLRSYSPKLEWTLEKGESVLSALIHEHRRRQQRYAEMLRRPGGFHE